MAHQIGRSLSMGNIAPLQQETVAPQQRRHSNTFGDVRLNVSLAKKEISDEFGKAALKSAQKALKQEISQGKVFNTQQKIAFLKTEARAVRDTAYGLRGMKDERYDLGRLGRDSYAKGDTFGERFNVHKEKDVGRDPGVLAKKAWSDKDTAKMNTPGHKFHAQSNQLIDRMLAGTSQGVDWAFRQEAMKILQNHPQLSMEYSQYLTDNHRVRGIGSARDFLAQSAHAPDFYKAMKEHDGLDKVIQKHVQESNDKFNTIHQIKGDYKERDVNFRGKVNIPFRMIQAKLIKPDAGFFGKLLGNIKAGLQYVFGTESKKSANAGMVREAVANDLMRSLGEVGGDKNYVTQKLKLVRSEYNDGTPKLMLDSTFIGARQTNQAFPGTNLPGDTRFETFEGRIVDGYLVDRQFDETTNSFQDINQPVKTDKQGRPKEVSGKTDDGRPRFKEGSTVEKLGPAKIKMLLLGDRDALGSLGANKGHVGRHMAMIDPGHSFESQRMRHKAINTDFSFQQPPKTGMQKLPGMADFGYKNFSIFDKAPLSEKMQGVKDIQDLAKSGRDVAIFDQYLEEFSGDEDQLNFRDEIQQWKTDHIERRDYILDVFAERLQVYDFNLGTPGAQQDQRVAQTFDLMDNLEKLTSVSSSTSPNGMVELSRPRVTERVEWHVAQLPNGSLELTAPAGNGAKERLLAFLGHEQPYMSESNGQIKLTVQPNQLDGFMAIFSDDRVMDAVKAREA